MIWKLICAWQMSNYSSMDGVLYCKTHFEQLFKEGGDFSKNFQKGDIFFSRVFYAILLQYFNELPLFNSFPYTFNNFMTFSCRQAWEDSWAGMIFVHIYRITNLNTWGVFVGPVNWFMVAFGNHPDEWYYSGIFQNPFQLSDPVSFSFKIYNATVFSLYFTD
jgi:hypothetical protein